MENKENTYENCYVAFLDILGFKEVVEKNSHDKLSQLYKTIESYISKDIESIGIMDFPEKKSEIGCYFISDSIILWSQDLSNTSFMHLVSLVNRIMVGALMSDLPLRGAVSSGPLTVKQSILGSTVFGNGLTNAYILEAQQKWSGCIVDKTIIENIHKSKDEISQYIENNPIFEKYDVPLKSGSSEYWVLNWPLSFVRNTEELRGIFESNSKKSTHDSVIEKIENTITFYQHFLSKYEAYRDYYILKQSRLKKDMEIYTNTLAKFGYFAPAYNTKDTFRNKEKPSNSILEDITKKARDLKVNNIVLYNKIVEDLNTSFLHLGRANWLKELILNIQ